MTGRAEETARRAVPAWVVVVGIAVPLIALATASRGVLPAFVLGGAMVLWMFATVGAPVLWVIARLSGRARHAATAALRTSLVLFCVLFASVIAFRWQNGASRERGDEIVRELEQYRETTGEYPTTLGAVFGPDPAAVPQTRLGWFDPAAFHYRHDAARGPLLWFQSGLGVRDVWTPQHGWQSED